jgi:hypothetical protein
MWFMVRDKFYICDCTVLMNVSDLNKEASVCSLYVIFLGIGAHVHYQVLFCKAVPVLIIAFILPCMDEGLY